MDIYLIRHAPAFARDEVAWPDDSERPLTPKGRRRWRRAARGLGLLVSDVVVLLSSPLSRAWETAMMLEQEAGWPAPQRCEALAIQGSPEAVVGALRSYTSGGPVAMIGHEPNLHELASYLLTGDSAKVPLEFRKGGCARLSFLEGVEPGSAVLRWLLLPRALRVLR